MSAADRRTRTRRSTRALTLCAATVAGLAAACTPALGAAVAPPATPKVAAMCEQRVAAAAATADEVSRVPRGTIELSGCVSDTSGIEHVVVGWATPDGERHGRICTDPGVVEGVWRCAWNTTRLELGRYDLELTAVDAAGNRGTSSRKYEVVEPAAAPVVPADPAPAPAPGIPPTDGDVTPPAASGPDAAPATPAAPAAPVAPAQPVAPTEPGADAAPPAADGAAAAAGGDGTSEPGSSGQPGPAPGEAEQTEFSAVQQLVLAQIVACEQGGVDAAPTDADATVTQREQAELVVACLRPALALAGADPVELRDAAPNPFALVATVADVRERAQLAAVLPEVVAGVPVLVAAPEPTPVPEAPSA